LFAVEALEKPGVLIGDMGVHDTHSDPNESSKERWGWRRGQAEVGYLLEESYWGKGYATEALEGFLQEWWGLQRQVLTIEVAQDGRDGVLRGGKEESGELFEKRGVLKALCEAENLSSLRVLQKCGFDRIRTFVVESNGDDEMMSWSSWK
jgi:RimJ/RimL family protein N-acetyltransferase